MEIGIAKKRKYEWTPDWMNSIVKNEIIQICKLPVTPFIGSNKIFCVSMKLELSVKNIFNENKIIHF